MVTYSFSFKKTGKEFTCRPDQFAQAEGSGRTFDLAFSDMMSKVRREIATAIETRQALPAGIRSAHAPKKRGCGSFSLPLPVAMTMHLHSIMLVKKVTPMQLARLLALTGKEVAPEDWQLDKIRLLKPKASPAYKKVQRLLDIEHSSSIHEISEAFRVLDCALDIKVVSKSGLGNKPLTKL